MLTPSTPLEVADILRAATADRKTVAIEGGGTKREWGSPVKAADLSMTTQRLARVVAHRYGDLTATVEAGARLDEVNRELARHKQWIPIDPPFSDRATIGGIVSTNDSGPRRHRYGAPRDLIIGVEFARADGQLAKGGGIVVKNVAGYDLPRLMTGAFGSLAVITAATFKLYPLPASSATLVVPLPDAKALAAANTALQESHLTPTAIEFETHPLRLLVRFESIDAAVRQQIATAAALLATHAGTSGIAPLTGEEESSLWKQHEATIFGASSTALKISTLPSELPAALGWLDAFAPSRYRAAGRAGLGVFTVSLEGTLDAQMAAIAALRAKFPAGRGSVVIVKGRDELRGRAGAWGPMGDSLHVMQAVKRQFDPLGILNPGRGPGDI